MKYVPCLLFCCIVALSAWPIGGNFSHVRTGLIAVSLLLLLFGLVKQFSKPDLSKTPLLSLILVLGAGFAIFQVTPFSTTFAALDSTTNEQVNELVARSTSGLSTNVAASYEKLCELVLGISLFLVATCLLCRSKTISLVMGTAAATGVAISFFAIIQKLSWDGSIFWSYELLDGGWAFGPFVNKNNAGGFLLACMSGAVFFIAHQIFSWVPLNTTSEFVLSKSEKVSFMKRVFAFMAGLQTKHLYTFAAFAFIVAGIMASLSRGAAVAMVVALAVSIILLSRANRWVSLFMVLIAVGALGLTVWAEQSSNVADQLQTLGDVSEAAAPRVAHWKDASPYLQDHYLLGTGLGTYDTMYPLYKNSETMNRWYRHAENIYIETLAELGVPGVSLLLFSIFMMFIYCLRLLNRKSSFDRSLGVAGMCCLIGQVIASCFDFGLYQPPNLAIVATMFGMVAGRAMIDPATVGGPSSEAKQTVPILTAILLLVFFAGSFWTLRESHGVECRRNGRRLVRLFVANSGQPADQLDQAEWFLNRAVEIRPRDSEAHYQLGEYHVARFRQMTVRDLLSTIQQPNILPQQTTPAADGQPGNESAIEPTSYSRQTNQSSQGTPSVNQPPTFQTVPIEQVWGVTTLMAVNRLAHVSRRIDVNELKDLKSKPAYAHLEKAWDCYLEAEKTGGFLPKTQFRLAQLSPLMESKVEAGSLDGSPELKRLEDVLGRWPANYERLYDCGLIYLHAAEPEKCCQMWRKCLTISKRRESDIIRYSALHLTMKEFFEKVLLQDPENMIRISRRYFGEPNQALPQRLLLVHTGRLIEKADLEPAKKHFLMGQVNQISKNYPAAAASFKKAVALDSEQVFWRYSLARCLHEMGDFNGALQQLKVCRLVPSEHLPAISRLIKRIERERARQ